MLFLFVILGLGGVRREWGVEGVVGECSSVFGWVGGWNWRVG